MYATVQEAMDDIPKGASVDNVLSYAFVNNANFRNLIVSTVATYGLYILASLLYADPWHMLTSFVQYMLLLPCSYNILMVYAFCNTHDSMWGGASAFCIFRRI